MIDPGRSDGGSASVSDSLRHGGTTRPGPARGTRAADVAVGFRLSLPVLPDDAARLVVPAASSSRSSGRKGKLPPSPPMATRRCVRVPDGPNGLLASCEM